MARPSSLKPRASSQAPASGVIRRRLPFWKRSVSLSWVWTMPEHPDCNVGDALSAVIVATLSGLPVARSSFKAATERLVAVGTIGHALHNGTVHLWGTGFDMARNRAGELVGYELPGMTRFVVHAVRGRRTGDALRQRGLDVPDAYGDPVWFLPRLIADRGVKTHELGVVVHITELEELSAGSLVRAAIARYRIPEALAGSIRIINTLAPPTIAGIRSKIEEIIACKRILSTSLHGLVIAETYGIPCAWFAPQDGDSGSFAIEGERHIDHRMKDFYSGVNRDAVLTYTTPLDAATDWDRAITFLDQQWQRLDYDGRALFDAFPLAKAVEFTDPAWPAPGDLLDRLRY